MPSALVAFLALLPPSPPFRAPAALALLAARLAGLLALLPAERCGVMEPHTGSPHVLLRFALSSSLLLALSFGQWLLRWAIWERCVKDRLWQVRLLWALASLWALANPWAPTIGGGQPGLPNGQ